MLPLRYTHATYADDNYVLGWAKDTAKGEWPYPTPDNMSEAWNPFIYRYSTHEGRLIKQLRVPRVKVPGNSSYVDGSIGVIPRTIDTTGRLILCTRFETIQPLVQGLYGEVLYKEVLRYNVVLFRDGQPVVLGKMIVQGQTVTPNKVISAKGSFAILEGTDSKGKTVAFTYHLR